MRDNILRRISVYFTILSMLAPAFGATLTYDYDAANDTSGDATWESETANTNRNWTLNASASPVDISAGTSTTLTYAYDFDPSGSLTGGTTGSFDTPLGGINASFELWIKPADLTGSEVIFETGGGTHGASILLVGNSLEFRTRTNTSTQVDATTTITAGDITDFLQVVGVVDSSASETRIYVNGSIATTTSGTAGWHNGADGSGLAQVNNSLGAVGSSAGFTSFDGRIARARMYTGVKSAARIDAEYKLMDSGFQFQSDTYSTAVLSNNPIAYWRMDDSAGSAGAMNQGSIGVDATGEYQSAGPTPQAAGLLPGLSNTATSFSGASNDFIGVPNNDAINTSSTNYTNKTVELWFKAGDASVFGTPQILYEQGGTTNGLNVYIEDRKIYAGAWTNDAGTWISTGVGSDMPHHVVFTYDAGQIIGYLDGQEFGTDATAPASINPHTGRISIGAVDNDTRYESGSSSGDNKEHFAGTIDEVALYNTTLSQTDVRNHLGAAGARVGIIRQNLLLNFNAADAFDFSTNPVWRNISGSLNNTNVDFSLTNTTRSTGVSSHPGITAAFDFSGSGSNGTFLGGGAGDSINDILGDAYTDAAASFEIWITPGDSTGRHILFESGGGTDGMGLYIDGTVVGIAARDGSSQTNGTVFQSEFDLSTLPVAQQAEFIQVVGIIDPATNTTNLYVNGVNARSFFTTVEGDGSPGTLGDWDGGDTAALGALAGSTGVPGSFTDFDGQIAIFRYYDSILSSSEVLTNYNAIIPEPATIALLSLGIVGLLKRWRKS